jgi:RNA polymerase sigma factor (sigma-70 family)
MTGSKIAELLDQHGAALVLFARQWCAIPEDVVQDVFLKLATLAAWPEDPVAWVYRAVRNRAIDAGKTERRRQRRESAVARPVRWFAEQAIDGLDAAAAVEALQALPGDQREVIVARLWGGMTLEQIGVVAGCSLSTVHRRFEAGVAGLRERLGVPCPQKPR